MGICHSSEPASAADATAKLILQDGRLQEFAHPVRASRVLQSCCCGGDPACFICDADDVGPDGAVSAVGGDEELRPGRLYFALPLSRLERPLEAKEMAALAVKASSAMKGGKGRGRKCRGVAAAFSGEKEGRCPAEAGGGGGNGGSVKRRGGGGGRGTVAILSAIPE
ncbi:uncharacterized protein LOC115668231 [Syzygium oleosum]|uniref:uncharacterized protein LOC115668231 n=1 Tax=Syzygium oleosum TaxID=219896 RepID=UPI0024BB1215|nr:uncharacterized protein LOC115668231 [Syzygium oleosum]